MTVLVADCETDGLIPELTKLHCLGFVDLDTDELHHFADQPGHRPIEEGLRILAEADTVWFHNGIKFDVPAIRKVYPWWKPRGVIRDSMLTAALVWPKNPTLYDIDRKLIAKGKLPKHLMGRHSLEAWGHRVGEWKGEYKDGWLTWSANMHNYMGQDCRSTAALVRRILSELETWRSLECVDLEHEVAWIVARQEMRGVCFDTKAATKLLGELTQKHLTLAEELKDLFPLKVVKTRFVPKANNKKLGYVKDVPTWKTKEIPFKPTSRDQIADRLIEKYGWKPTERTDGGKWKIDDDILSALEYPEAKKLAELFMLDKRLGTLANGKQALLKCEKNGRIHGRCDSNGTVTGRATHSNPNVNLPQLEKPYGKEFRALFKAGPGCVLVGTDADSLEGRVEAGFTVQYDGGAYRETILSGSKEEGTDLHTRNMKAIKPIAPVTRPGAKAIKYAWTYGAGDPKLGAMTGMSGSKEQLAAAGSKIRKRLLAASPGLKGLVEAVDKAASRGYLWGLDGRKLIIRSKHAAVNTLFQSAGSIIFKKAMVLRDLELTGVLPSVIGTQGAEAAERWTPGVHFEQVLWVHDEVQVEAIPEIAEAVGQAMSDAIKAAGEHFDFKCPMGGNSDVGNNWAETH